MGGLQAKLSDVQQSQLCNAAYFLYVRAQNERRQAYFYGAFLKQMETVKALRKEALKHIVAASQIQQQYRAKAEAKETCNAS